MKEKLKASWHQLTAWNLQFDGCYSRLNSGLDGLSSQRMKELIMQKQVLIKVDVRADFLGHDQSHFALVWPTETCILVHYHSNNIPIKTLFSNLYIHTMRQAHLPLLLFIASILIISSLQLGFFLLRTWKHLFSCRNKPELLNSLLLIKFSVLFRQNK